MPAPIEMSYFVTQVSINMHLICEKGKNKMWQNTSREAQGIFLDNREIFYQLEETITRASDKKFKITLDKAGS